MVLKIIFQNNLTIRLTDVTYQMIMTIIMAKLSQLMKTWWSLLLLIIMVLFVARTLFSNNLAVTHDLEIHAARTANYYLALKQGQIPPRWAPNLNYGFGYPTFIFSYHTPYLVASIFFVFTNSIELSVNLFTTLLVVLAGLGVYFLVYVSTQNRFQSFVLALSYISAPYFLLNIFVRGAVGEIAFLGLLPWVMLLLRVRKQVKTWWYIFLFPIFLVAWLLSHQVLVMITLPILLGWVVIEELNLSKKQQRLEKHELKMLLVLFGIVFAMVIWSWLPMLLEKNLIVANQLNYMKTSYDEQFPALARLIWSNWQYSGLVDRSENGQFTQMVGVFQWLIFGISAFFLLSKWMVKKSEINLKLIYWLLIFIISLLLMLDLSLPIWKLLAPLQNLQLPWRLLFIPVLASTMMLIELFPVLKNKVQYLLSIVIVIWYLYVAAFWARPVATFHKPIEQWLEYHLSGDSFGELRPIWFELGENLRDFKQLYFLDNQQNLTQIEPINLTWTGTHMSYNLDPVVEGRVIQKTLYYPGWRVIINDLPVEIDYQLNDWSGRITYTVANGPQKVEVVFSDRGTSREFLNYIGIFGIGIWLLVLFKSIYPKSRKLHYTM